MLPVAGQWTSVQIVVARNLQLSSVNPSSKPDVSTGARAAWSPTISGSARTVKRSSAGKLALHFCYFLELLNESSDFFRECFLVDHPGHTKLRFFKENLREAVLILSSAEHEVYNSQPSGANLQKFVEELQTAREDRVLKEWVTHLMKDSTAAASGLTGIDSAISVIKRQYKVSVCLCRQLRNSCNVYFWLIIRIQKSSQS